MTCLQAKISLDMTQDVTPPKKEEVADKAKNESPAPELSKPVEEKTAYVVYCVFVSLLPICRDVVEIVTVVCPFTNSNS